MMIAKLLLIIGGLGVAISYSNPGLRRYESYLCAARRNFTSGLLSCNEDCQLSHGAAGGACYDQEGIDRYNCICGAPIGRLPAREQQCIEPSYGYEHLCEMDCKCNHAAIGGKCLYHLKACLCHGHNPNNDGCPASNFEHFKLLARIVFEVRLGKLGPSWLYERLQNM